MFTIATAGHIDHGKSSLVRALTGIDPDRLPEEKERQMTIELGFAHFRLSGGEEVGIIDVPGHERFIKTMISGVSALDMVMFVIAADDGWMPQSEEHLAILRYLGVERGIIVLTKVDLVEDDWKEMVKLDLRNHTKGTFLVGRPIIEFSATDNRNLDEIFATVEEMLRTTLRSLPARSARLYVDRTFTVAGTGTVVTGTLREGNFAVGQELYHHPSGAKTRVKSLESFYSHLETAPPGIRLAVGLQALERGHIARGDLLYWPDALEPSQIVAVKLNVEAKAARHLKNNREILFLHGTSEVEGNLVMPASGQLAGDGATLVVIKLAAPVICKIGDRFVLRLPTPSLLVGGGLVIDAVINDFERKDVIQWDRLALASSLATTDLIVYQLLKEGIVRASDVLYQSLIPEPEIKAAIDRMSAGKVIIKRDDYLIHKQVWDESLAAVAAQVKEYHDANQHLVAMSLAELNSRLSIPQLLLDYALAALVSAGKLQRHESGVKLSDYSAGLSSELENLRKRVIEALSQKSGGMATRDEIMALDKEAKKVYTYLKQNGLIVDIGGSVYLRDYFDTLVAAVVAALKDKGKITVAEARDLTGTSRKVVLPVLEDLDRRRVTRREGDYRYLCE
ncbi:MAG: selenocysteine-specific translation elongation factor [Candidatus Zixiibacteriota bacterium]